MSVIDNCNIIVHLESERKTFLAADHFSSHDKSGTRFCSLKKVGDGGETQKEILDQ